MRFVSYIRVSTRKQQASGLGLEAQQASVAAFVASRGEVIAEFREVESGKQNNRVELAKALKLCELTGATLLVAKLDRLSRNAAFLINLRDSRTKFIAVDMPEASDLTVGIMALVAQQEREAISARTKAALQAAKARGVVLGGCRGTIGRVQEVNHLGRKALTEKADRFAARLRETLEPMAGQSLTSIAQELNRLGILTSRGTSGNWSPTAVSRVLDRLTA